jgi:hypothetical protein
MRGKVKKSNTNGINNRKKGKTVQGNLRIMSEPLTGINIFLFALHPF